MLRRFLSDILLTKLTFACNHCILLGSNYSCFLLFCITEANRNFLYTLRLFTVPYYLVWLPRSLRVSIELPPSGLLWRPQPWENAMTTKGTLVRLYSFREEGREKLQSPYFSRLSRPSPTPPPLRPSSPVPSVVLALTPGCARHCKPRWRQFGKIEGCNSLNYG